MGTFEEAEARDALERQRKNVRRSAIILGCVAFAFYVAFIAMSVARA